MRNEKRGLTIVVLIASASMVTGPVSTQAVVTQVARYPLGNADPGAVAGNTGNFTTVDLAGGLDLIRGGDPTYSGSTPDPSNPLSMDFDGVGDVYTSSSLPTTVTDNFGIEAWVRPDTTTGNSTIAYNGNSALDGWGIRRAGSSFAALFGGVTIFSGGTATIGAWTHVAVVRDSGTSTLYVNCSAVATSLAIPSPPTLGLFEIGASLDGTIDEVRVFTFSAGQFNLADLNCSGLPVELLSFEVE